MTMKKQEITGRYRRTSYEYTTTFRLFFLFAVPPIMPIFVVNNIYKYIYNLFLHFHLFFHFFLFISVQSPSLIFLLCLSLFTFVLSLFLPPLPSFYCCLFHLSLCIFSKTFFKPLPPSLLLSFCSCFFYSHPPPSSNSHCFVV